MKPRFMITVALMMALIGAISWGTMVRQEDPDMPDLWGMVVVSFPGADVETMERLVIDPVEERLAEVDDMRQVTTSIRNGFASMELELLGGTDDIDEAWDDVREALEKAAREFPAGAFPPVLDPDMNDQDSVVLAITGSDDPAVLRTAARRLRDRLLGMQVVSKVNMIGDPGDQVRVEIDDAAIRRLGLDFKTLTTILSSRNQVVSGGTLRLGDKSVTLRPRSEFRSVQEIEETPILLPSGGAIPLGAIARVVHGVEEPAPARMRFEGQPAVGLGIVPGGGLDIVRFGEQVQAVVQASAADYLPLEIHVLAFQPDWVEWRISGLGRSLLIGILIVAAVVIGAMGIRLGLVVSSVVPLVALASLAIWAMTGGVLHQISIAALVIALGMLVDNAIVVAENIQSRIDRGASRKAAAREAVRELRVPLAAATGTTVAVFVPMMAAEGATAAFTLSIPLIVTLTLAVSYVYATLVTPVLCRLFLRPAVAGGKERLITVASRLGRFAVMRPGMVLTGAVVLIGLSIAGTGLVNQNFFPASDRNILIVDLKLPEGTHLSAIDQAAAELEQGLRSFEDVESVSVFIGESVPHFYYNLPRVPHAPNFAQVMITTSGTAVLDKVSAEVREWMELNRPDVEVVSRRLEQGPPVTAPVEVRLVGVNPDHLRTGADQVLAAVMSIEGATDGRHDAGVGAPSVWFQVDDAEAARHGVSRADVASALYGRTQGNLVGQFRAGDDPVPVVVRSTAGENFPVENLEGILVYGSGGKPVPLGQIATLDVEWRPAVIRHFNGSRVVNVRSELEEGFAYSQVLSELSLKLETMELPPGVSASFGGAAEGAGEANTAMLRTVPMGMLLLLGILLLEFNSFRRLIIILATVPLAMAGIVPGLVLGNQPFGFMSMLGVIALVGVVVNNAIVLLDLVERLRGEGEDIRQALIAAVTRRTRPILLTTATTVAGLMPLALSDSPLWPPMAWAMISGLIGSTLLTLLVVPALYLLLFRPSLVLPFQGKRIARQAQVAAVVLMVAIGFTAWQPVRADELPEPAAVVHLTLEEALAMALTRPVSQAARLRAEAADDLAVAERRATLFPTVNLGAGLSWTDEATILETPIGDFPFTEKRFESYSWEVIQPLFDPVRTVYTSRGARKQADSASNFSARVDQLQAASAARAFILILRIDAAARVTESFVASLAARLEETDARVVEGRVLASEALKVRLALDAANQDLLVLSQQRRVALRDLQRTVDSDLGVEPVWNRLSRFPSSPDQVELVRAALATRPDLIAGKQAIEAADLRTSGTRAERLPRLDARVAWSRTAGSLLDEDGRMEWGVALTWRPLEAGTRWRRISAANREADALRMELEEARRDVEIEVLAAFSGLEVARGAVAVGIRGMEQAEEALRVEQARYEVGRVTTNDLLQAEAALREQRTKSEMARFDFVRAWIDLRLAAGENTGSGLLEGLTIAEKVEPQ